MKNSARDNQHTNTRRSVEADRPDLAPSEDDDVGSLPHAGETLRSNGGRAPSEVQREEEEDGLILCTHQPGRISARGRVIRKWASR